MTGRIAEVVLYARAIRRERGQLAHDVIYLNRLKCDVPGKREIQAAPRRGGEAVLSG
jgi:hypothetical protein